MTKTAWATLPNAAHISRVLAHVQANPDKWDEATVAVRNAAMDAALDEARGAAWHLDWNAAWNVAWVSAWSADWDACMALITWDEAGDLVGKTPQLAEALRDAADGCFCHGSEPYFGRGEHQPHCIKARAALAKYEQESNANMGKEGGE